MLGSVSAVGMVDSRALYKAWVSLRDRSGSSKVSTGWREG